MFIVSNFKQRWLNSGANLGVGYGGYIPTSSSPRNMFCKKVTSRLLATMRIFEMSFGKNY